MKISARNVLSGKIVYCVMGKTTAHVKVEIAGGDIITSTITNEAVEDLELFVGRKVAVIVKASDVLIGVGAEFGQRRRASPGREEAPHTESAKRYTVAKAPVPRVASRGASPVRLKVRANGKAPSVGASVQVLAEGETQHKRHRAARVR